MLLLDIGNTNLRWTTQAAGRLGEVRILRHGGGMTLDLLAAWEALGAPSRILVSNVGGAAVAESLRRVTRAYWGLDPEFVSTRADFGGVRIAYAEPARFGVDRWLTLIAAHAPALDDAGTAPRQPTLILDAGTAATFDLLLADGRHLGGLILPGIEMMRNSLLAGTQIPRIESEPVGDPWAQDTGTAVAAGSVQAIAALARRLLDRLTEQAGATPRLLLTGGDAQRLRSALDRPFQEIPDLVLRGLLQVAERIPLSG
ncbi:type III pantothenate kinase [Thiocystis violascens]|uniref:Type III pantothenate kinase n=1 Tax=Thiocystis violascens (strain ATCC 17096 / DSM 198 / 6111) TaxID=765911 RepID=I3Y6X2_THIV6|nr:type III pantothenate kinase [Thiocystis violascens]AFL72740.1 pantothenate kinase, type III [Thiocystis violascens DSM 198]